MNRPEKMSTIRNTYKRPEGAETLLKASR